MGFCGYLKQSTEVDILLGPFIDDTDGKTAETGLTVDVELSKNGQALADSESAAPTHDAAGDVDGYYNCVLGTTDTGTLGILAVVAHAAGFLPVHQTYQVVTAHWYDTMCSTDKLQVDVTQWLGQAVTADTNVPEVHVVGLDDAVLAAAKFGADCITEAKIADNAIAAEHIAAAAIDNATFAADVGSTAYATNIIALAVRKALDEIKLDHLIAVADADDAVNDSIIAKLASSAATADWSGFVNTTDSLQALRDRGDAAWTTGAGGSDRLLMVDTTIATLASQTSFTLTAGSADDDAYNNCTIVIEDASTATQKAVGVISDYTGATKTVTLKYDPGIFTMATTDKVYILAENALKTTLANRQLNVAADGDIAGNIDGSVASVVGHTAQTGDSYAIVNSGTYGNAQLLRSTTPANALDVSATGEAGLDFDNIKDATGAHTLTNITVPTCTTNTDMRGTDSAALASVLGALNDVAADGDPTDADTLMQYLKQLINILVGTAGVVAFPAEAAPANAVSLAEVIRAIHTDVTGLNGDAMRGTDGANTTVPDAAGTLAAYDPPTKAEMDTAHALLATVAKQDTIDTVVDAIKAKTDNLPHGVAKNTELASFEFLMIDSTDHLTPKTGETVTAERSIDGAAFGACANSVTEVANGVYKITLAAADLNGNVITLKFTAANSDQTTITIVTST